MKAFLLASLALLAPLLEAAERRPAPIQNVEIRERAFYVNGQPFFPIMAWLQDAKNFPSLKSCGMNSTAGYHSSSSGTKNVLEYQALVERAGLYGVMPFDPALKGQPALLGYIHDDEPDLPHLVSDAVVEAGAGLRVNNKTPLWKLVDGDVNSWSVLDPMEGARLTIRLPGPVTVVSLGVAVTTSKGLAMPSQVVFEAGGREILKTRLAAQRGLQKFTLPASATFQQLTLRVLSVTPGEQAWGSIGEIEGYDREGKNVLLAKPRYVPRAMPESTLRKYRAVKTGDPTRPLFMTLTGHFHPHFKQYTEEQRAWYPQYIEASDVVGYDIYPIYGWNKPEWLHLVQEATDRLVQLAGKRPVYAWIETSKGGQWTGELSRQKDVKPEHIRAEVWMCLCRGATAIGYFTHIWKPEYSQFGVPEENQQALRQINEQITRLTPAILGKASTRTVSIKSSNANKLDVMAREAGDSLYVFAVNYDERARETVATISVDGLAADSAVTVVDENRALKTGAGVFTDTFAPLAVHIYRLPVIR